MARPVTPQWHKGQNRWYARVGERNAQADRRPVYMTRPVGDPPVAPPQGKTDVAQAWRWLEAFRVETEARQVLPGDPSVRALCELYLKAAEDRVSAGSSTPPIMSPGPTTSGTSAATRHPARIPTGRAGPVS